MADGRDPAPLAPAQPGVTTEDVEPVLTTPEDVASAGRSCMAIVVLGAIIIALVLIWVVYRTLGG